jgi:hypothetical protein
MHGFIRLAPKRIHFGDVKRVSVRLVFKHAGKRSIGIRLAA